MSFHSFILAATLISQQISAQVSNTGSGTIKAAENSKYFEGDITFLHVSQSIFGDRRRLGSCKQLIHQLDRHPAIFVLL